MFEKVFETAKRRFVVKKIRGCAMGIGMNRRELITSTLGVIGASLPLIPNDVRRCCRPVVTIRDVPRCIEIRFHDKWGCELFLISFRDTEWRLRKQGTLQDHDAKWAKGIQEVLKHDPYVCLVNKKYWYEIGEDVCELARKRGCEFN